MISISFLSVGIFLTACVETELTKAWLSLPPYRAGTARDRPESGGSREPASPRCPACPCVGACAVGLQARPAGCPR
ncbi:hypothetical protein BN1263550123 [Stenotrophomonas indicatrix]|nr:hypothetical protein BN1263550123 [Stenotrophomonas indicatrix]